MYNKANIYCHKSHSFYLYDLSFRFLMNQSFYTVIIYRHKILEPMPLILLVDFLNSMKELVLYTSIYAL